MDWKAFFRRLLWCWNPAVYDDMSNEKFHKSVAKFFGTFLALFILLAILFIPGFFVQAPLIQERFDQFTAFEFTGTFEADAPITLLEKPKVVYDENASSAQGAQLVFADEAIFFKRFYWFGNDEMSYDVVKYPQHSSTNSFMLFAILLWPAFMFWAGIFILVKAVVLIIILSFFGWLLAKIFKQKLSYKKAIQAASYAAIPALLIEVILLPFWYRTWIPLIIFILWFAIGIALLSEKKIGHGKKDIF